MSLRINTNVDALSAYNNLNKTSKAVSTSIQRLSTGLKINSAADDAAGLSISERMRGQIRGLGQAASNIGEATSMVQTAEGNLDAVHGMLQRVRELAVQYHNGSLSTTDQGAVQSEVNQLASEIDRIGTSSQFNGIDLLKSAAAVTFQVGANDGQTISVSTISLGSTLGTYSTLSAAGTADIANIDKAINAVSDARASFGSVQNRLGYALDSTNTYQENLTSAESSIRDVDVAKEMTSFTKNQILQQAGTAMLAQANQAPQSVLKLIG